MNKRERVGCLFHFDQAFADIEQFGGIDLYQIGEICCECGYVISPHRQFCLELSCVVSGSGYFYVDDTCIQVGEGDIIFNGMNHMHTIRADESSLLRFVYMGFKFNEHAGEEWSDIRHFLQASTHYHTRDTHSILIPFLRGIDEFYSHKAHSRTMIKNYLEEIIVLSYRAFTEQSGMVTRYSQRPANSVGHTVYSVIRYVENRIFELKSIRSIADELGYSYTYLSHTFKDKTGMTLQRYINQKKVEKALELLKFGNLSIKQVAEKLQYETLQSFSKAFSRVMGYPPSQYVAMQRAEGTPSE